MTGLVHLDPAAIPANPLIRLNPADNVAVARVSLPANAQVAFEGASIRISRAVAAGHKVAVAEIPAGGVVFKYGEDIGRAGAALAPGDWVHTHNLLFDVGERKYEFATARLTDLPQTPVHPRSRVPRLPPRGRPRRHAELRGDCRRQQLLRLRDAENRGCVPARIVRRFRHRRPSSPCPTKTAAAKPKGRTAQLLRRTLDGLADHPNVAAAVVVGLGCEVNQIGYYTRPEAGGAPRRGFTLQESGGNAQSRRRQRQGRLGVDRRGGQDGAARPAPASKLTVSLECGRLGRFFGKLPPTPASGYCSDLIVKQGGTACLGETTEIWGAEHLLTRRAVNRQVGRRLLDMLDWYFDYVGRFRDAPTFNSNPSPGNRAGGISNIAENRWAPWLRAALPT